MWSSTHRKAAGNKYSWDERRELFELTGVLPAGAVFPYDFGYIPKTEGEDGDALDVLVLRNEPAFTGCLVVSRLIGVIEAEQTERNAECAPFNFVILSRADGEGPHICNGDLWPR